MTHFRTSPEATIKAAIQFMAHHLNITPQDHKLDGFAGACFDSNSVRELVEALTTQKADKTDCKTWNITPTQWRAAVRQALEVRLFLAQQYYECNAPVF